MASKRTSEAPRQDRDAKKPRILQKFLLDYTTDWPVLKPSTKGATFCYCCTCRLNFSIGHGGRDDCKRHMACKRHKEYAELRRTCPSVSSTFKQKETPLVLKTTLMDSNLPLSAANKFTKTLKEMFPDSEIARCDAFLTESLNFQRNHVFGP